jgi:undecaprenyl-diphosphatase
MSDERSKPTAREWFESLIAQISPDQHISRVAKDGARLASDRLSLLCAFTAFAMAFWGLFDWDVPLTRFIRSLYHPVGYLPNPWLAQLSDSGDQLGKGDSLVILSLLVLAGGFALKQAFWKAAGWQSLLAHGVAALISNLLKHLIGRPRPKFVHAGNMELAPGAGVGWDSFPSGHASATFAVATVLAVRFPRFRWVILSLAAVVAASRVLRGSHFLTDTVAGAALGYVIGSLVANPWRDWRSSMASAFFAVTPFLTALLALVWTIGHQPMNEWPTLQLIAAGVVLTVVGLLGHALQAAKSVHRPAWLSKRLAQSVVGLGLGMTTGSVWVTATMSFVCLGHWLRQQDGELRSAEERRSGSILLAREAVFSLLVLLGLLAAIELRGALPML